MCFCHYNARAAARDIYMKLSILASSVDEAGLRMIRANIDAFRQIGIGAFPSKESNVNPLRLQRLRCRE